MTWLHFLFAEALHKNDSLSEPVGNMSSHCAHFLNNIFRDEIPSPICCLICYTFEKKKKDGREKFVTSLNYVIYDVTNVRFSRLFKLSNFDF